MAEITDELREAVTLGLTPEGIKTNAARARLIKNAVDDMPLEMQISMLMSIAVRFACDHGVKNDSTQEETFQQIGQAVSNMLPTYWKIAIEKNST